MRYGAKNALWAPWTTNETSESKPAYDEPKALTGLNETADTINMASASAYGDNMEAIYIGEFSSGDISVKAVEIEEATRAAILGTATGKDGGLSYGAEDEPSFGGYGFYRNMMTAAKKRYYEVVFYPKVSGVPEAETSKTKENSISLEYDSISFRLMATLYKSVYKLTKCFDTEEEAQEYLKGLFAGDSAWPGIDDDGATASAKSDADKQ